MTNPNDQRQCAPFRDDLAELSLGILTGRRRSEVLGHVDSCAWCSTELEQLSIVADTVLELAPEFEPPLGFELRLAERLREQSLSTSRRLPRVRTLLAAALVMVLLGFGINSLTSDRPPTPWSTTANLTAVSVNGHRQTLGKVFLSSGSPGWMVMTVDQPAWSGRVTCEVTLVSGKVEDIGRFTLSGGYGTWGVTLTSSADQVRSAELVAMNGDVIASAQLKT